MLSPLYGQLSPLRVPTTVAGRELSDADAIAYIAAVETADAQTLEDGVKFAFEDFILGCKSDGIWSAIKASCILAGARTLSGALVPLIGTAPTNFNFVSSDYNRETGLKGNRSTKYLKSNYTIPSGLLNNTHLSVYLGEAHTPAAAEMYNAAGSEVNIAQIFRFTSLPSALYTRLNDTSTKTSGSISGSGFVAAKRSDSSGYTTRTSGSNNAVSQVSSAVPGRDNYIFARNFGGVMDYPTSARLSFYSIGESLDLASLDTRVSTLMTDLATAIP